MSNLTINYGLKKPEKADYFDIEDFNGNSDIIDSTLNNKLDKTGVAADSAKLGGKSSSSYVKRIDLSSQVQTTSIRKSVIAFCCLDNTDPNLYSASTGTLIFRRANGFQVALSMQIDCQKVYASTNMRYAFNGSTPGTTSLKPCTFKYNGILYGGIQFFNDNAEHSVVIFEGDSNFEIFGLDYADAFNNPLNTEVFNSLEFTSPITGGVNVISNKLVPFKTNIYSLGDSSYKWNDIYAGNSVIQTSDKRQKTDIQALENEKSIEFLKELKPIQFRFNDRVRTHYGFNAQEVEEVMNKLGIDFAGFIKSPVIEKVYDEETGEEIEEKIVDYDYGLRYSEFIPLLLKVSQLLYEKTENLEKITRTFAKIDSIKQSVFGVKRKSE